MAGIAARFENGVLHPLRPLTLRQGEQVEVIVIRRGDAARWDLEKLGAAPDEDLELAEAGLDVWTEGLETQDRR